MQVPRIFMPRPKQSPRPYGSRQRSQIPVRHRVACSTWKPAIMTGTSGVGIALDSIQVMVPQLRHWRWGWSTGQSLPVWDSNRRPRWMVPTARAMLASSSDWRIRYTVTISSSRWETAAISSDAVRGRAAASSVLSTATRGSVTRKPASRSCERAHRICASVAIPGLRRSAIFRK